MAARTTRVRLDENWREKIQTSMLLIRLEKHALGEVELSATQIKAIEILLRKALPDLQSIEHSGSVEGGLLGVLGQLNDRSGAGAATDVDNAVEAQGTGSVRH
jgi:hypothetical protein